MVNQTPYLMLGGEPAVYKLVERFYYYMDNLPDTVQIRNMHAADLSHSKQKLFKFLSGWLGGPDLYIQEFGHPRLRMRHFPFAIGERQKQQWMLCMQKALQELDADHALIMGLQQSLDQLAQHMVNRSDD